MIEILIAWAALLGLIYTYREHNKTVKEYKELLDDYDLLQEENIKIRKGIAKVKEENQDLIQIILKYHEN